MQFKYLNLDSLEASVQPSEGTEVDYDRSILECCKQHGVPKFCYGFCKLRTAKSRSTQPQHCVVYAQIFEMCVLGCKYKSF